MAVKLIIYILLLYIIFFKKLYRILSNQQIALTKKEIKQMMKFKTLNLKPKENQQILKKT